MVNGRGDANDRESLSGCQRRPARKRQSRLLGGPGRHGAAGGGRVWRGRRRGGAGAPLRPRSRARLPLEPAHGHGRVQGHSRRGGRGRRGGRVAVQPPRPRRPPTPPRSDPDGGQLERAVARPCRHAQPQRQPHQGRRPVQHPVERGLPRRLLPRWPAPLDPGGAYRARRLPRPAARSCAPPPRRRRSRPRPGRCAARGQGHPRGVRRGLHGDVQRHHRRRDAEPDGDLQGAPQPVGAGGGDARRRRRRGHCRSDLARGARHALRHRRRRSRRTHRRPDPRAGEDVRRCGEDRARVRLRRRRHPVPAGPEGHGPGQRPGGGAPEQRRAPPRARPGERRGAVRRARPAALQRGRRGGPPSTRW